MNDYTTTIFEFVFELLKLAVLFLAFYHAWKGHRLVNSRMTELLEITRQNATFEEKAAERKRQE